MYDTLRKRDEGCGMHVSCHSLLFGPYHKNEAARTLPDNLTHSMFKNIDCSQLIMMLIVVSLLL